MVCCRGKELPRLGSDGLTAICWSIWKSNFFSLLTKKKVPDPIAILCQVCALMRSGRYNAYRGAGIDTMLKLAKEVLAGRT